MESRSVDNQVRVSPQTRGTVYLPTAGRLEDQEIHKTIPWEVDLKLT